ncbi:programmed cell death protein 2-like [Lepeophtheirus salmonis]|uniref:programmed cell death protein 2-like n=1 Tax=Lepeophtheirus salmonis TaxID=72036 RepID=UPI001AE5A015|nr:programmed cell death protein 2-like [Lepeophtheirus salmonis]
MARATSRHYSQVILGFVDEQINDKYESSCDYTTNKIGGSPNWMPDRVPSNLELSCPLCESFLSLICQVYAPLENSSLHRTLYLFACLRKTCWNSNQSWKCFRSEIEDTFPPSYTQVTEPSNVTVSNTSFQTTDWAQDADDWGSEEDENGNNNNTSSPPANLMKCLSINDNYTCKDSYDLNEYDDEEEDEEEEEVSTTSTSDFSTSNDPNANDVPSHHKKSSSVGGAAGELRATAVIEEDNEGETNVVIIDSPNEAVQAAATTTIPSLFFPTDNVNPGVQSESFVFLPYFLAVEEEYELEEVVSDHERRLLWEFRSKESMEDEEENKVLLNSGACSRGGGGEMDVYEKAVPRHGDIFYHKFLTVLQKNPGQVLRYSRDNYKGPLLVSKLSSPNKYPDKCSYCGGPLIFEFQILSSLVSYLKTSNPDEGELEFGTVIIFTCKKSCYSSNKSLKVEYILVQAEPM